MIHHKPECLTSGIAEEDRRMPLRIIATRKCRTSQLEDAFAGDFEGSGVRLHRSCDIAIGNAEFSLRSLGEEALTVAFLHGKVQTFPSFFTPCLSSASRIVDDFAFFESGTERRT